MKHDDRTPEQIRAEVDRSRRELDATLAAIEHRLSPQRLAETGIDYLKHSGAREFASNLGDAVKHNPMAVVLVGVGLGWLMASRGRPSPHRYDNGESSLAVRERASDAVAAARSRISRTTETARERWDGARESVASINESARHQVERARAGYDRMMHDQPLALGCIGLALGMISAAGLPRTREEDAMMGEASDRLAEKAARAGAEQIEKVEQGLEAANQARRDEARAPAETTSASGI